MTGFTPEGHPMDNELYFKIIAIVSSCFRFSKIEIIDNSYIYIKKYTKYSLSICFIKKYIYFLTCYMDEKLHFDELGYDWKQMISIYYLCNEDNILFPEQDKISHFFDTQKNKNIINDDIIKELKDLYLSVKILNNANISVNQKIIDIY
jgi:hypothetical protein